MSYQLTNSEMKREYTGNPIFLPTQHYLTKGFVPRYKMARISDLGIS